MKSCFFLLLPFGLFGQSSMEGPWIFECGASSNSRYKENSILNFRYISPRFRWSQSDWTEEEEQHPEDFKKARIMWEVLYGPPLKTLATGINIQYQLWKYKRLRLEAFGGVKFFFLSPGDMIINPHVAGQGSNAWYINAGLLCQLDLGLAAPFADIGTDGIYMLGAEIDIRRIYKKVKRKFRAPYLKQS